MRQRIFLLILVGATLMACSSTNSPAAASWDTQMGTTSWQLMQLGETSVADDAVTIELIRDDQGGLSFNGQGFCNNYSTLITVNNTTNTVTLGSVASTRRMCPDPQMQQERDYFAALEATTNITITADKLIFASAQGQALLTFVK
ncbi:MAG: hypothetical protein RL076_2860 [Chloroflexota bacterium]|jgi:heat shock protein HslJ